MDGQRQAGLGALLAVQLEIYFRGVMLVFIGRFNSARRPRWRRAAPRLRLTPPPNASPSPTYRQRTLYEAPYAAASLGV